MPSSSILIKPASSNCNIDCRYCFYKCLSGNREEYSKGFMSEETLEELVRQAVDYADGYLAFAFQGGEPTLAGIDYFRRAVELQKRYNTKGLTIENTIQTNGILMDEQWAEFLAENHFLVGLSLDGPKKLHDRYRKDITGNGTFERLMQTAALLEQYHVDYNILSVITGDTASKAAYLYKFYKNHGFSFIQLIPCMDERNRDTAGEAADLQRKNTTASFHSGNGAEGYTLEPVSYGKFLNEMFDLWYDDFCRGSTMDIRMFSNLAQMAAGYPAEQCGMNGFCNCYFVVEGDGSVYPCDFYCMDEWKLGTVKDSFKELLGSDKAKKFVESSKHDLRECVECPYFSLCRGGCRRWREPFIEGKPGRNALCEAYKLFFEHTQGRIRKLGQYIQSKYS